MKTKRVGTISMAIVLIALGVLIFMSQINKNSTLEIAIKLWPLVLILLGIEILYFRFISKDETVIRYDIFSIFIVFIILFTNLGLFALTETGVLSKISTMALTDTYNIEMPVSEFIVEPSIKKIIIDAPDSVSIRSTDKNTIIGSGKLQIDSTSKEDAMKFKDEEFIIYKKSGETIYISFLSSGNYNSLGYSRPYEIDLQLPKDIDVEVKNCSKVDIVYDDFNNNWILDNTYNVDIRLDRGKDIVINAYVESEDYLSGNIEWKFNKIGEYIRGDGNNLIKILKSNNITVNEI